MATTGLICYLRHLSGNPQDFLNVGVIQLIMIALHLVLPYL